MMTERYRSEPFGLLRWQADNVRYYAVAAATAWLLIRPIGMHFLELPVMPISTVGAAIGIFASFRANQAYDRWWEGRKLWGRIVNASRHFSDQVRHYLDEADAEEAEGVVMRHLAWVHALRCQLRGEDALRDPDFRRVHRDPDLDGAGSLTHALVDRQHAVLTALARTDRLDERRLQSLDRSLEELLGVQGGCERIKGTPLPRGYGAIIDLLIRAFAIMLPFSLVHDLGIVAVPLNVLVCLAFALISEAGRVLEDPFSLFYNGLPLHALSIKIERNVRERLGHSGLPPEVGEDPVGILM